MAKEIIANVTQTCNEEARQKQLLALTSNGKGSHAHREISTMLSCSKTTEGEKCHQSRSTSEIPREEEAEGQ
jgi:hypothetical protein